MIRIGWFSPLSPKTGIATYTRNVLAEMKRAYPCDEIDVVVFYPPSEDKPLEIDYPIVEISDSLLRSDFWALFDVAVYHLGNNDLHHGPIYQALQIHPGIVVLHDHVYQHYLVAKGMEGNHPSASLNALLFSAGGPAAFEFFSSSGFLSCDKGEVLFVPWESAWATEVPLGDRLARLGVGAVVHSDYGRRGLGENYQADVCTLFMPRPDAESPAPVSIGDRPVHIVCAGHIQVTKGLQLLVAAFAANLEFQGRFKVTIAGYGSNPQFLQQLRGEIEQAGLTDTFDLVVDPTEREYNATLAAADIFFNLRYPNTEGASLSLVEQMAFGRPVIAYRTGSFAEMPEDACYFLNNLGEVSEIVAVLQSILDHPDGVAKRGSRAWKAVEDRTAEQYARDFVAFLRDNIDSIFRRQGIVEMRRHNRIPHAEPRDAAWLSEFVAARRLVTSFFDRKLLLPDSLFEVPDLERGRFVALGLLGSRISEHRMEQLGRILGGLSRCHAIETLGQLILLSQHADGNRDAFYPKYLQSIQGVVTNLAMWRVLTLLDPGRAAMLGFEAMGEPFTSAIAESVEEAGFYLTLYEQLISRQSPLLEDTELLPVLDILRNEADPQLDPIPLGEEILGLLGANNAKPFASLIGFNPLEPEGMWTNSPTASLFVKIPDAESVNEVQGSLMFISTDFSTPVPAEITVTETTSGREETCPIEIALGDHPIVDWQLALPAFKGLLQVKLFVSQTNSPRELGLSDDERTLGLMLRRLLFSKDRIWVMSDKSEPVSTC
ncbi:glycosyltransferase family 4 protein [Hyphobacterium sp.]|uniref:glycosyltransferase family 4 protein n=1 Tax=Hyphobacterium sp. TaxID=2004662 RepID=UPI0037497390